jgi:hypothetical protein
VASLPESGDSFQVAPGVLHGGRTGPQPTKLTITCTVEKDKPLASTALGCPPWAAATPAPGLADIRSDLVCLSV